jgi:DNA primase
MLAERAGVELTPEKPGARDEREKLFAALEAATKFYQKQLTKNLEAKKYLAERGLKDSTIESWRLGFAPSGWRNLSEALVKEDFKESDLEKVGLIKRGEKGSNYDRFRSRIIFPLRDISGRVVGFSGRLFGEGDGTDAKYLNSPETPLFDKSAFLYGLDVAKSSIRRKDFAVLVEGQMDLLMSQQAGVENTVALSGTALTDRHLALLKRFSQRVIMAFDADSAGVRAAERGAELALSLGMEVKVAALGSKDPADLIKENPKQWMGALKAATHLIDFELGRISRMKLTPRSLGREVEKTVVPKIASIRSSIEQAHFVAKAAKLAGVSEEIIWQEVKKTPLAASLSEKNDSAESKILNPRQKLIDALFGLLFLIEESPQADVSADLARDRLKNLLGEEFETISKPLEEKRPALLLEAEILYTNERLAEHFDEIFRRLGRDLVSERLHQASSALKRAEAVGDKEAAASALNESKKLSAELSKL